MKITLNKQSGIFLTHKLANSLERNTNWKSYVGYYWKGNESLRNARFDLVLYDNELNIKAIFWITHNKKMCITAFKFNDGMSNFFIRNNVKKYYEFFKKENISFFFVNLNEKNESKVLEEILEKL